MRRAAYISVWLFVLAIPLGRIFIGQAVGADIPVTIGE